MERVCAVEAAAVAAEKEAIKVAVVMSKEGLTRNPPARLAASREDG